MGGGVSCFFFSGFLLLKEVYGRYVGFGLKI